MLRKLSQRINSEEKGFTLIELLVVILIIGILAAIALPAFLGQRSKGQDADAKSNARNLASQVESCYANEQTYVNCRNYFGMAGQPVNVIIAPVNNETDGSGGAYHHGCSFNPGGGDLYIDAAFGNPVMTTGLIVAELTESFMGAQNKGLGLRRFER